MYIAFLNIYPGFSIYRPQQDYLTDVIILHLYALAFFGSALPHFHFLRTFFALHNFHKNFNRTPLKFNTALISLHANLKSANLKILWAPVNWFVY